MTDRHIPVDSDLNYFTVTCHLAPIVADFSQDSDYDPNTARIDAVVTFTPKYKTGEVIHSHTSTPPTGFLALPVTAMIDDGYLKLRSKADLGAAPLPGTLHGLKAKIAKDTGKELPVETDVRAALNYAPVRLLGNSASLEIDPEIPLYYDFSFSNVKIDGKQTNIQITGGTFEAPWDDELIDLLDYMPLTPGPFAGPMVVGPQGPQGEQGPATIDVGSTTTSAPGSDASVSNVGDTVNAVLDFVIPRGDVGPPGPAGGLLEFDSAAVFPAAGEAGYAYLAKDTGDTYRWDPLAKAPTYVRISERVKAAGIEDSSVVGRSVVTAVDELAGRAAIGAIGKADPATGDPAVDVTSIDTILSADAFARVEDGTYVLGAAGVTVPAGKRLLAGDGALLQLQAGLDTSQPIRAVILNDGASFIGAVDANRDGQDKTGFNAAASTYYVGIGAYGTAEAPLTGLHVDATVTGSADYIAQFSYVNDSHIRIRAEDCGGPVAFFNCTNLRVDIEVDDHDNKGWKIWPHAVDFLSCSGISGRVVIRGQKGTGTPTDGTALSAWFTGLTIVNSTDIHFDEVDAEAADLTGQSKGLGVSLLGVQNINVDRLRVVGFSDLQLEMGSVVNATFSGVDLDGRYATSKDATAINAGVALYNGGNDAAVNGRTSEHTKNVKFMGGRITRMLGNGIFLKTASDTSWFGVKVTGCLNGVEAKYTDMTLGVGPATVAGSQTGHRFTGCDFSFNERSGTRLHDIVGAVFVACRAINNCQAQTFGTTRKGAIKVPDGAGFGTVASTQKPGLLFYGCQADDTQGTTGFGFPDPSRPKVVAVDKAELYEVGQTLTVVGAGAAGADLLTRVDAVDRDELTLQHPVATVPAVTLTGTIATAGTAVTGTGTSFLTELVGRAFVKVGADYRRVLKVTSNTAAVLDAAFPANVPANTPLVVGRVSVQAAKSQLYGYYLTTDTISPQIVGGYAPQGNVTGPLVNGTAAATRLRYMANSSSSDPEILELGVAAGNSGIVQVNGPDANHALTLRTKGTGSVTMMDGSGNTLFQAGAIANGVNRITVVNAAAGGAPAIMPTGNDANIGLNLYPKGTGVFTVYVPTGQTPTIQGSGQDAKHGLHLSTKGGGLVTVQGVAGVKNPVGVKVPVPAISTSYGEPGHFAANNTHLYVYLGDGVTHSWGRTVLETTWAATLEAPSIEFADEAPTEGTAQ
jgi:hypothetical protein